MVTVLFKKRNEGFLFFYFWGERERLIGSINNEKRWDR